VVRSKRNAQGIQQNHYKSNSRFSWRASIEEVQTLIADTAIWDGKAVKPVRKVVENVTSAGRGLGKVLSERVSDIGDRNTRIAELFHERIGVGDVRDLIRYGFIYEDGHG
jgi:hypothetical protein